MAKITYQKRKQTTQFGDFIKKMRVDAGLSQSDVAREMGYSTSQFVSNWERGQSSPPVGDFKKLGRILGIEPNLILKEFDEQSFKWVKEKNAGLFARSK